MRENELGQPIGFAIEGWRGAQAPVHEAIEGTRCRLEPVSAERHAEALHEAFVANAVATRPEDVKERVIRQLVALYGTQYREVLDAAKDRPELLELVDPEGDVIGAQIVHSVQREMARRLVDVITRRTDLGTGEPPSEAALERCAALMAEELGWGEERIAREIETVHQAYGWNPA